MQILQSTKEIEKFFADLVSNICGIPTNKVLLQFSTLGQSSFSINTDWCAVKVMPTTDERNIWKDREKVYNSVDETFTYITKSMRTLELTLVFYGPSSTSNATLFNEMLYSEDLKFQMKQKYLALVPDRTIGPLRFPEQHNAQWYERCDLVVKLYNTVIVETKVSTFKEFDIRTEVDP